MAKSYDPTPTHRLGGAEPSLKVKGAEKMGHRYTSQQRTLRNTSVQFRNTLVQI